MKRKGIYYNSKGTRNDNAEFLRNELHIDDVTEHDNNVSFSVDDENLLEVFEHIFSCVKWLSSPFSDKVSYLKPLLNNKGADITSFDEKVIDFSKSISASSIPFGKSMPITIQFETTQTEQLDDLVKVLDKEVSDFTLIASNILTLDKDKELRLCRVLFTTSKYSKRTISKLRTTLKPSFNNVVITRSHVLLNNDTEDKTFRELVKLITNNVGLPYRAYDEYGKPMQDKPDEIKPLEECIDNNNHIRIHIPIGFQYETQGWQPLTTDLSSILNKDK